MKKPVFSLFAMLATMAAAPAANIAWMSFHSGDDTPSDAAATAGFTEAPDVGFTDLLASAGHNVDRFVSTGTPDPLVLNTYDMIIVSRSSGSGNFDGAGATAWNTTITAPVMFMSGYAIRQSRLGLMAGSDVPDLSFPPDNLGGTTLTTTMPSSAIFTGVDLTEPYVMPVTYNELIQRGPTVIPGALQGGGIVYASVESAPNPAANGAMVIGFWEQGSTVTHDAATNVLAGDRWVFLAGSREQDLTSDGAGIYDLTEEGAQLFLNTVAVVPEPSGAALALLGGLALGLRRRRSA